MEDYDLRMLTSLKKLKPDFKLTEADRKNLKKQYEIALFKATNNSDFPSQSIVSSQSKTTKVIF